MSTLGNIIVGQSGGPTSVINSSLAGVFKTAKDDGARTIYGMRNGIQGLLENRFVDMKEGIKSDLDVEILKRTPSSYLGSCRYKLPDVEKDEKTYENIFAILKRLEIDHFFYIGGNDSMDTIKKLSAYAKAKSEKITFVGVPKTIDNDLAVTDHTPGFGSAAKYIGTSVKEIIRDALVYDMKMVTVVEIMGRNAGWLTASAALAKTEECDGVDMIFLPELDFDLNLFADKVKKMQEKKKALVIAVSEGLKTADGTYVCKMGDSITFKDSFGHTNLGGTGMFLANKLAAELGCKTRTVDFSTLQRCAAHITSRVDVEEAFAAGTHAVKAAFKGETGKVVVFNRVSSSPYAMLTELADVAKIANVEKQVPSEWIINDGTYISDEFLKYAKPLIQGEIAPYMVEGLPRHLVLR
ncbi:MAG: 6-phosphofructokinase [Defluviitaleaceae bacterium]|nr:6-phosphofructokinase [Defluviitaleaceae bacterium]